MLSCRQFEATHSHDYTEFYEIEQLNQKFNDEDVVNVKIYVLGYSDAHILLTSDANPKADADVYEIGTI